SFLATHPQLTLTGLGLGTSLTGGAVSRQALMGAAQGGGPTLRVVTNLTQEIQDGRSLSTAAGEGAQALANAAREGGRTFASEVPTALIEKLEEAKLLQVSQTSMEGVTAKE